MMLFSQAPVPVPVSWTEFGLAGAIIAALMGGFYYFYRDVRRCEQASIDRHYRERAEIMAGHAQEREVWRKEVGGQNQKVEYVINELTLAIKDQVKANEYNARIHDRNSRSIKNIAMQLEVESALEHDSDDDITKEDRK